MSELSFEEAQKGIIDYESTGPGTIAVWFSKEQIIKLLKDNNADGVRFYKFNDNNKENFIASPTKADGDDQTDIILSSYNSGRPCPTMCGKNNGLNSKAGTS